MGGSISNAAAASTANGLNTAALTKYVSMEVDKVKKMKAKMAKLAAKGDNAFLLTRKNLKTSLKTAKIVPNDQEVVTKLFTCFEIPELDGTVYWQQFLMGLCVLVGATLEAKIAFAMDLFGDITLKAKLTQEEFVFVVNSMNDAMGYLGDKAMRKREIRALTEDVWANCADKTDNTLDYQDKANLQQISNSKVIIAWLDSVAIANEEALGAM